MWMDPFGSRVVLWYLSLLIDFFLFFSSRDLSGLPKIGGTIPPVIGNLTYLQHLYVLYCCHSWCFQGLLRIIFYTDLFQRNLVFFHSCSTCTNLSFKFHMKIFFVSLLDRRKRDISGNLLSGLLPSELSQSSLTYLCGALSFFDNHLV